MRLGSRRGVDMLVRIVEEKQVAPAPEKPRDATRLRAEGFHDGQRLCALHALDVVATQSPASGDGFNPVDPPPGPWKGPRFGELDEVSAAVRAWWDASRERIEFDGKAGCWRIRPK